MSEERFDRERQGSGGYGYGSERQGQDWGRQGHGRMGQGGSQSFGYGGQRQRYREEEDVGYGNYGYGGSSGIGRSSQNRGQYGGYQQEFQGRQGYGQQGWGSQQQGQYTGRGPKGYQRSDERIREEVCEELTRHPEIDASEIEVSVKNCEVTLKGTVESRQMKRTAEECIENLSGVKDVENQLRVSQPSQYTGSESGQQSSQSQGTQQSQKRS